ncbi:MAG: helix-turn-helix domain-containing protein [Bacilli bacterium]|nr:helix-turn-helix domain-containing protein [Bacilli bacterium]
MAIIRSVEEKKEILKRYFHGETAVKLESEYGLSPNYLYKWINKYNKDGFEGLKSKTGKLSKYHKNMGLYLRKPKNKIEELEIEVMKKDIEIARLKKGYNVKGVSQKKEFVTTFSKNTK